MVAFSGLLALVLFALASFGQKLGFRAVALMPLTDLFPDLSIDPVRLITTTLMLYWRTALSRQATRERSFKAEEASVANESARVSLKRN